MQNLLTPQTKPKLRQGSSRSCLQQKRLSEKGLTKVWRKSLLIYLVLSDYLICIFNPKISDSTQNTTSTTTQRILNYMHIHPFVLYDSCIQTVILERIHLDGCSILRRFSHCIRNPFLFMMLLLVSPSSPSSS